MEEATGPCMTQPHTITSAVLYSRESLNASHTREEGHEAPSFKERNIKEFLEIFENHHR